ncbi:larval cuticle protein 1-like [Pararge aegeria]|uniref:Jg9511 protein n=1 Tax=Pararge aegeria aegeria TaxID=348720 RepID=A0A8S4RKB4_9NEOP|nr:larval cuticle protein 1-like [Pararge aegeria]CAH2237019.1 jg9511 [Pararge aegeria aegeria]
MVAVRYLIPVGILILLVNAAPIDDNSLATIIENEYTIDAKGNYRFRFVASNGITREESGTIVNDDQPNEHILVIGRYSYFNPEGLIEMVEYRADDNGYTILPPRPEIDKVTAVSSLPANAVASLLGK